MSPSRKSAPPAVVGLDIGTDSIKVAEAKIAKDGITITGLGISKIPQGVIENEVIVDPVGLGNAIKALLAESGIKTKKCVSSVSGASQVVVRVISVPKMKQDELADTMKWEVERHVPFSPQEVVMDFQPLVKPSDDPDATEMEVLLAVAQEQLVNSHVEALFAAGLRPMAIDIEPLATSRALIELDKDCAINETVAIVNMGSTRTEFAVFENGLLVFPSPPLGVAGINFTREISEALGQTLEQAEVTKREFAAVNLDGFDKDEPEDVVDANLSPSEPTAYDTAFGPGAALFAPGTPVGTVDDSPQTLDEPTDYSATIDDPVFDTPDPTVGPAFDLGDGVDVSSGLSFDLDAQDVAEASAGPSFDLDSDIQDVQTPSPLAFDLGDDDPEPEPDPQEVASPSFDLSDAGAEMDHGQEADIEIPVVHTEPVDDNSTEGQVFKAISGVLVDLANELRMSLEYYTNRYSKMPERLYLCGGTAKIPNLDKFLSRELGLPVVVADPVKNLPVVAPGVSEQYLGEISPLFAVCIGLAIRDMIG